VDDEVLAAYIMKNFDMRPKALIEELDLLRPGYKRTAAYGHFGRAPEKDGGFSWERTDLAAQLKKAF
jgi:S-adenosylmethionine synthetase